eukprot:CAMPEP_0194313062 /NCGR_PEP_ID=MMETSP0171-20130528/9961_1 /TAXON_ID=218684 /ORGANISM="Corethron pennatum, Strain L29A3" /LENGTH=121 /DNA_ID=CAMNT_0039067847 /DNA_START=36 /DNA_END=397 /DNA_ORIENTATION=-
MSSPGVRTTITLDPSRRLSPRDLRPLFDASSPPVRVEIADVDLPSHAPAVSEGAVAAHPSTPSDRAALLLMVHHAVVRTGCAAVPPGVSAAASAVGPGGTLPAPSRLPALLGAAGADGYGG